MAITGQTIVVDAARELNVIAAGEPLPAEQAEMFLSVLSRLIDNWNAEREAIYATQFLTFVFTPGLSPHTIGPTGTWTTSQRPVKIEGATVVLSGVGTANQVNAPQLTLHDSSVGIPEWFQSLPMPNITTSYPTDGYYSADWPNGKFYLWPVPSTAYHCQIQVRAILPEYDFNTTFSMPPGYRDAVILTLAEASSEMAGVPMPQTLPARAAKARNRIFANNTGGGILVTQDAGIPSSRGRRSTFNWLTGLDNGRL